MAAAPPRVPRTPATRGTARRTGRAATRRAGGRDTPFPAARPIARTARVVYFERPHIPPVIGLIYAVVNLPRAIPAARRRANIPPCSVSWESLPTPRTQTIFSHALDVGWQVGIFLHDHESGVSYPLLASCAAAWGAAVWSLPSSTSVLLLQARAQCVA